VLTSTELIYFGIANPREALLPALVPQLTGAGAGILLLKVSIALLRYCSHSGDPSIPIVQAVLGAVVAMVGPGAWSIDARLFGRKRIDIPEL